MLRSVPFLMLACFALVVASCSEPHMKKVVVMANGKLTVDQTKQKIKLDPSNTHNEQELEYNADKVTLTVETPDGTKTFDMNEDGLYVLNLKVDTLTGGLVNYSAAGRAGSMSREQLDRMIDSTQKLIVGVDVSDEKKNYFIVPGNIKKITGNTKASIVGPYKGIPYKVDEGAEVYKFFTNKQQRESLGDLLNRMNTKK